MGTLLLGATGYSVERNSANRGSGNSRHAESENLDRRGEYGPGRGGYYPRPGRHGPGNGRYGHSYFRAKRLSYRLTHQSRSILNTIRDLRAYRATGQARRLVWATDSISNSFGRQARPFMILNQMSNELRPAAMQLRTAIESSPVLRNQYHLRDQLMRFRSTAREMRMMLNQVGPGPGRPGPGRPGPGGPYSKYECTATNYQGWGIYTGYGRTRWEAERTALQQCETSHRMCRINRCRIIR